MLAFSQASEMSGQVDALFIFLLMVSAFFTVLIAGMIVLFVIKYKRRQPQAVGVDTGEHPGLEWLWFILPLILTMFIFVWGARLYIRMARPPASALQIQVIGKQWMWKVQHPSGRKEIDELHVPLGQPVQLMMTSVDVIHSFYIPSFRVKQDVLPNRYSTEWFTPTELGTFHLFCSQYCGTGHDQMIGHVIVMTPGDYAKWAADTPFDQQPAIAGAKLFTQYGCIACHGQRGPTLAGIYGRPQPLAAGGSIIADEAFLRETILNPRAHMIAGYPPIMPSFQGQLSEEQLYALIAYIKSLGPARQESAP